MLAGCCTWLLLDVVDVLRSVVRGSDRDVGLAGLLSGVGGPSACWVFVLGVAEAGAGAEVGGGGGVGVITAMTGPDDATCGGGDSISRRGGGRSVAVVVTEAGTGVGE